MRRFNLLLLVLLAHPALAEIITSDKETTVNTRYLKRNPTEVDKTFQEANEKLPPLPGQSANWFPLHINRDYQQKALIDLNSLYLAPDRTVRYVLNIQSQQGFDNLTAEALYCAENSFDMGEKSKRSSYKVYGYGDSVNNRWIQPRNPQWQNIGAILNTAEPVHAVIYRAFCEDGLPSDQAKLIERLKQRAGSRSAWQK